MLLTSEVLRHDNNANNISISGRAAAPAPCERLKVWLEYPTRHNWTSWDESGRAVWERLKSYVSEMKDSLCSLWIGTAHILYYRCNKRRWKKINVCKRIFRKNNERLFRLAVIFDFVKITSGIPNFGENIPNHGRAITIWKFSIWPFWPSTLTLTSQKFTLLICNTEKVSWKWDLDFFPKSKRASRTNEPTNQQTNERTNENTRVITWSTGGDK